jgi:hypothetical protein
MDIEEGRCNRHLGEGIIDAQIDRTESETEVSRQNGESGKDTMDPIGVSKWVVHKVRKMWKCQMPDRDITDGQYAHTHRRQ